ncbi:MAG: hypothetical protein LBP32_00840, partial [Spirochaetaceae bacterium]|nr:hypothetical protein [Spirochaetaceae bacterium]
RETGEVPARFFFDEPVPEEKAGDYLKFESMRRAAGYIMDAENLGERYSLLAAGSAGSVEAWRLNRIDAGTAIRDEAALREGLRSLDLEVIRLLEAVSGEGAVFRDYRDTVPGIGEYTDYMANARSIVEGLHGDILAQENQAAARQYTIANGELEERLNRRRSEFTEGNSLIEGVERILESTGAYIAKYPLEGLAVLSRMEGEITADIESGGVLLDQYREEDPGVISTPELGALRDDAQSMVDQLLDLQAQGLALAALARTQADQAEALRLDGDRLFMEASDALARNNFEIARDRLLRSGERYDASLAIEDSASLRAERDARLPRLGAEITRLENELIIREVRQLVTNARTTYFAGNFEDAEEMLVRAQNRWLVTNAENNPEVVYWLTVVRGALALRSGRTIHPTAPLYPEMSQLLSEAKKNYDEGVLLINADRRAEGLVKFAEARQKIQEVKLMFPVNEEAGILELRMDQVTDPASFNASFRQRLDTAIAGTERRSQEAFADLQNLAAINPRYPGIRAILDRAEIAMGIRPPPPDPGDLAQSSALVSAAQAIINSNIRAQFPVALEQLNRALELNPNNALAMSEKDRVQTMLGGEGTIVLNSAAEGEYKRAVLELQQGNTIVAMAIVQQLLQDPRNRTTRILELQRRIESLL